MTNKIIEPEALERLIFGEGFIFNETPGKVIHIFGEAGSGRTTLALQIACNICSKNKKVLFIDTEGKVSGTRIKDISGDEHFPRVNKFLKLYSPANFTEQQDLIQNLDFFLINQKVGMIIIDTITNLYRAEGKFGVPSKNHYEKLAFQVALLRNIAKQRSVLVLLLNQATMNKNDEGDELLNLKRENVSPVAKAILNYWSDREIILVSHGWGEFEARIPGEFEGRVKFKIDNKGVCPLED